MLSPERSFYAPILKLMGDLGFVGVQEIKKEENYVDILFESGSSRFVLEVKIEKRGVYDAMMRGIVQAYGYGLQFQTKNLIVMVYPSSVSEELSSLNEFDERALKTNTEAVVLTENWEEFRRKITVEDLLNTLKAKIDQKVLAAQRIDTAAAIILRAVVSLSRILNKHYKDDSLLKEVANSLTVDYGLFVELSTHKISGKEKDQTISLLAYILVNQILFYYLYAKHSQQMGPSKRVDELKKVGSLPELDSYFDQIRGIDYKPIFDILVIQRIPPDSEIVEMVNKLIEVLAPLRVDELRHDLYGQLFSKSLPEETRTILASYYTKESSADLLAALTIDQYSDTVWDLACGSGTLLVSSYDRKMRLYRKERQMLDQALADKLHLQFIQEDITGTDIMPFACHLTGLNLSAKNLRVHTDFLRIAQKNSLSIASMNLPQPIEEAYGGIGKELSNVHASQQIIEKYLPERKPPNITPKTFILREVDRVVVNPPFTGINRLPQSYRDSFTSSSLSDIGGRRINLWGHFLSLTDKVLRNGGKVGAIIPLSFLHGKDTYQIRKFYLEQYSVEYIIKPFQGGAFSQDAEFTDMMLVARKTKPDQDSRTKIICLKVDIDKYGTVNIDNLAKNIRTQLDTETETDEYLSYTVNQSELLRDCDNLARYVFADNLKTKNDFEDFTSKMRGNPKLLTCKSSDIEAGYELRSSGKQTYTLFTMRYSEARVKRSQFYFDRPGDRGDVLTYHDKEAGHAREINKTELIRTFRTITGVNILNATGIRDYLLLGRSNTKRKAHLFIANRFRLNTPETYLTALYVEELVCPVDVFTMYFCEKDDAKILALYFNSVFYWVQLLMLANQSTGGFVHLKQIDLEQVLIPDLSKLQDKRDDLLKLFEQLSHQKFDSLVNQLTIRPPYRYMLDKSLGDSLGTRLSKDKIFSIYDSVLNQIKSLKAPT